MDELDSLVEPHEIHQPPVRLLKRRAALLAACADTDCGPGEADDRTTDTGRRSDDRAGGAACRRLANAGCGRKPASTDPQIELVFSSQVLGILPYEVARRRGLFADEGLNVNLVSMRGGAQAMNALIGGSIDWAGTPMALVVRAAGQGKPITMIALAARLPFLALVTSPTAPNVRELKDLASKKAGVGNLGTTDHLMAQYLLTKANVDPKQVEFVALGPNLDDLLVKGEVHAGMVQELSLTLVQKAGGPVRVNFTSRRSGRTPNSTSAPPTSSGA